MKRTRNEKVGPFETKDPLPDRLARRGDRVESFRKPADASVSTLLRNHALRRGPANLSLGRLEGIGGLGGVSGFEGLPAMLHNRAHMRADVLVSFSPCFGLANSLESGFMIGQFGLSSLMGGAS